MTEPPNDAKDPMELTPTEKEEVERLRASLADLISNDPMAKDHSDDYTLWRFLVARDWDTTKADAMFRGAMEWRKKVGIDELWEAKRGIRKKAPTQGDKCYYGGLCGTSREGGAVMVERLGKVDAKGLAKNKEVFEELKQSYIIFLERAFRQVRSTGNKTRAIAIVDLEGMSRSHILNISVIKEIAAIGPPNYPEVTCGVFILRAPWVFTLAWKMVRPLLPKDTAAKVSIWGSNFLEALREKVSDESIPSYLGGSCTLVDDEHDDFDALAQPCPPPSD